MTDVPLCKGTRQHVDERILFFCLGCSLQYVFNFYCVVSNPDTIQIAINTYQCTNSVGKLSDPFSVVDMNYHVATSQRMSIVCGDSEYAVIDEFSIVSDYGLTISMLAQDQTLLVPSTLVTCFSIRNYTATRFGSAFIYLQCANAGTGGCYIRYNIKSHCYKPPPPSSDSFTGQVWVIIVLFVLLPILVISFVVAYCCWRKRNHKPTAAAAVAPLPQQYSRFKSDSVVSVVP